MPKPGTYMACARGPVCGAALIVVALLSACNPAEPASPRPPRADAARTASAVAALQAAKFADAVSDADAALAADSRDARAAAVRAIGRYQRAGDRLVRELGAIIDEAEGLKFFDHAKGRSEWQAFLGALDAVDADLAIVAADPQFALELCMACWQYDWNRNGEIDDRDRRMFDLEYDGSGGELAERDPRRKPTFRFDVGDALWARAMIAFQRGAVELVLAYKWSDLDRLFNANDDELVLTIKLIDAGRVKKARELVLAGLGFAAQTHDAYLAETDDDREWVPSPRQKSYAMPLAVDAKLYATWRGVISDVHRMLSSHDGIPLRQAGELLLGKRDAEKYLPDAYVDLGRMFREPKDIVLDFRNNTPPATTWRGLLGNGYTESMRATPLVGRLGHMKAELETGGDTVEKKLRYLFWLN